MKSFSIASLAAALGVSASEAEINPIRRVVTLMQEMQKEIEAEGEKEKDLFDKFMCYCKNNDGQLAEQAKAAAAEAADRNAKVEAQTSEKKQVDADLAQAKKDRTDAKKDLATATKLREKENKEFVAENADAVENLNATDSAIKALKKGMGASFMQTKQAAKLADIVSMFAEKLDVDEKEAMVSFLSQSGDYHAAGGQIVGILENMKDEMEKDIGADLDVEKAAQKAFNELKAAKKKEINALSSSIENYIKRSGQLAVSIVQNKNSAEDAAEEGADAAKFAANLKKNCATKEEEMAVRVKTRNEEIAAVGEAIKMLNDDDALDLFNKTLPKPPTPVVAMQPAFLQVRRSTANVVSKARALVAEAGTSSNKAVALLASSLTSQLKSAEKSGKVDFSKVLKMIDDMVALLTKEQNDDEKHRDWCNTEFDVSEDTGKDLNSKISSTESAISELKDSIAGLAEDIKASQGKIADLDKSVAEATAQRKEENLEFRQTTHNNGLAVELIKKAINRLNKFYNPDMYVEAPQRELTAEDRATIAAGGTVDRTIVEQTLAQKMAAGEAMTFVQIKAHTQSAQPGPAPETWDDSYGGKGKKSNGVISLMNNLVSELESDNQAAESDEKQSQKDYEELSADAAASRKEEAKSITTKSKTKADQSEQLEAAQRDLALSNDELAQLNGYIADLHQSCDFIVQNFDDRREKRSNEITGLDNAKAALNGANYA
jgi:septal ring factor EnvC (AmiA/AmiB activator)